MLDEAQLGAYIDEHFHEPGDTLFRLETLPEYAVASDGDDYRRFLEGAAEPTWSRKQPWLDRLRRECQRGLYSHRVRVLTSPLTAYQRYACEWGYALNGPAGEDIRVLDLSERPLPEAVLNQDFWLINRERVVAMHYDRDGHFLGATVQPAHVIDQYRAARDAAWEAAEPFDTWWRRHPEHHRSSRA